MYGTYEIENQSMFVKKILKFLEEEMRDFLNHIEKLRNEIWQMKCSQNIRIIDEVRYLFCHTSEVVNQYKLFLENSHIYKVVTDYERKNEVYINYIILNIEYAGRKITELYESNSQRKDISKKLYILLDELRYIQSLIVTGLTGCERSVGR